VQDPDTLLDLLAAAGSGYHFFRGVAPRIVLERIDSPSARRPLA
jgi:hypothetical protein